MNDTDLLLEALRLLEVFADDRCICGHAKSRRGESHFFGDPRPGEPSSPWCMAEGCKCVQYTPDYHAENRARLEAQAFLDRLQVSS